MKPVLYTGIEPGGQLTTTTEVENFPGYPNGTDGTAMMEDFKNQAIRLGAEVRMGIVTKVSLAKDKNAWHQVMVDDKRTIEAKTIIISTGARAKYLGLESEQRLRGGGVSACAVCDGFFFKKQEVVVVGGGDTAAEEATYLSKLCSQVHLLVRKSEMRASKAMQRRLEKAPNIKIRYNTEVVEVLGSQVVEGVKVINNQTQETEVIPVTGLFVAIGHDPNSQLFRGALDMDADGYIITKGKSSKTNLPGVFACGDVQDKEYRQAVTAAGSGCMAALDAEKYLASLE